jgi:hypothetical protein
MKKIYTEWGIFYTAVFKHHYFIFKDNYLFYRFVSKIDMGYISNVEELKTKISNEIDNSKYLMSRKQSIEDRKKRKEMKKLLNSWSGFTNKQLERDHKIRKIIN